jgi:hypothetical protein
LRLSNSAVEFFRRLVKGDQRRRYLPLLGRALAVYSGSLLEGDRVPEAVLACQEALDLFRSLPEADPERKSADYAGVLMEYGVAARRAGNPQSTWDSYQEALSVLEGLDSEQALSRKALILYNSSNLLGDSGTWPIPWSGWMPQLRRGTTWPVALAPGRSG